MDAEDGCAEVAPVYDADFLDADLHTRLMSLQDCRQNIVSGDEAISVNKVEPWNSIRITLNISREGACTLHQLAVQNSKILRDLGILSLSIENGKTVNLTDTKVGSVPTNEICTTPVNPPGDMTPVVPRESQTYGSNLHHQNVDVRSDFAQRWPPDGFSPGKPFSKHFGGETKGWMVPAHARREHFAFPVSKSETFGNFAAFHDISNRRSIYSDCLPPDARRQSSMSLAASHDSRLEALSARHACRQDRGDHLYKNFESGFGEAVTVSATTAATAFNRSQNDVPMLVSNILTEANGWVFDEQRAHGTGVTSRDAHLQTNWANARYYHAAKDLGNAVFGPPKCGQEKPSGDDFYTSRKRSKIAFDENKDLTVDFERHRHFDPQNLPTDHTERRYSLDVSPVDVDLGGRSYVPTAELCSSSDFSVFSPASLEEAWDSKESISCDQTHAAPLAGSSRFAVERALTLLSESDEGPSSHKTVGNSGNVLESSVQSSLCHQALEQSFDGQNSLVKLRGMSTALERNMGDFRYGDRFASCDCNSEHFFENRGRPKTFNDNKSCSFGDNRWSVSAAATNKMSACRSASFGSSESYIRADGGRNYPRTYSDGGCAELQFSPLSRIQTATLFDTSENPGYNPDVFSHPHRSAAPSFSEAPTKSCNVQRSRYASMCNLPISTTHDSLQNQAYKKSFYESHQKMELGADCVPPGSSPRDNCAWNEFDLCGSIPDSGIASNTSSGGSDLSELERTLGGSAESFTRCQEMAEARSRFQSGGTADEEVSASEKRHGYLSKPLAQNNSSGVHHVEPFFHKDAANSGAWHENLENSMSGAPTECPKGGFPRSRNSGEDQNQADANAKVAEMPANVSSEHNAGPESMNSGQKVRVKLKVASHPNDASPPKITGGCFEPSITCPNLPRRLSESIKLVMRGVPLVGTPSSASVPAPPASAPSHTGSDPTEDARPSTVIRITKTRSTHSSKQKETWSIQPVVRQSQNTVALVAFSVHETAPKSSSCADIPPQPASSSGDPPRVAKPTKFSSKFARKVVIDVDSASKRCKLTTNALPFGTARCRLWQNGGTKGHKRNSNPGGQASCERDRGGIRVETKPFRSVSRSEFDAKGLEKRTSEDIWRADATNKQRCGSYEKFS